MRYRTSLLATLLTATTGALLAVTATPAGAQAPAPLTDKQIAAMTPAAQAALLQPLRDLADALATAGKSSGAAWYTNVALDANTGRVDLYATDTAGAQQIIRAAKKAAPAVDTSLVRVHRSVHTSVELHAARDAYIGQSHPFAVYAVGFPLDGQGLTVEVADPGAAASVTPFAAAAAAAVSVSVGVSYTKGAPRQAKSWNDVKWHDSAPFIGGDVLTHDGEEYCTAGLPAVRKSDNHPIMITAAHCFGQGQRVYTAAGATWDYFNGRTGNYVGTVTSRNTNWDAEELDGANNNADESDTTTWLRLTQVRYSYTGDYVCQSGSRSAALGHPTPCGIKVTNPDLWFPVDGYNSRGVEGVDVVNGWGSVQGDSGGTVFALFDSSANRQARGIISAGGADGTSDQARVDWTEAIDIFNAYGLKLNPQT